MIDFKVINRADHNEFRSFDWFGPQTCGSQPPELLQLQLGTVLVRHLILNAFWWVFYFCFNRKVKMRKDCSLGSWKGTVCLILAHTHQLSKISWDLLGLIVTSVLVLSPWNVFGWGMVSFLGKDYLGELHLPKVNSIFQIGIIYFIICPYLKIHRSQPGLQSELNVSQPKLYSEQAPSQKKTKKKILVYYKVVCVQLWSLVPVFSFVHGRTHTCNTKPGFRFEFQVD